MTISDSAARLATNVSWASDATQGAGNRQLPEDANIRRTIGFGVAYQQPGTGFFPQRRVFNQRYFEWDEGFKHKLVLGIPDWDSRINYFQHAFVQVGGILYVALVENGPEIGNGANPTDAAQAVWRLY